MMSKIEKFFAVVGVCAAVMSVGSAMPVRAETAAEQATNAIRAVQRAFAIPDEQVWVHRVRMGGEKGHLAGVCRQRSGFQHRTWALLEVQNNPLIARESLPQDAPIVLERLGKEVVWGLLRVLEISPGVRSGVYCSNSIPDWGDGVSVLEAILSTMESVGLRPADFDTTETALRERARDEFRRQIAIGRVPREAGPQYPYFYLVCRAIGHWNFMAEEMGLTPQEADTFSKADVSCGS